RHAPLAPRLDIDRHAISEESRDLIRQSMQRHIRETAPDRERLEAARRQLHDQLTRAEWDSESAAAAFARVRQASMELQASIHGNIIETLGQLSPDERAQAFEAMARRGAGPRHGPPGHPTPMERDKPAG
ncbi:MAG: periplasmic heavy metal sensor, partial [Proteobacteria bacterium]|nr:periplasmic heavy metal sensor [Pseudomonadota bacterium]